MAIILWFESSWRGLPELHNLGARDDIRESWILQTRSYCLLYRSGLSSCEWFCLLSWPFLRILSPYPNSISRKSSFSFGKPLNIPVQPAVYRRMSLVNSPLFSNLHIGGGECSAILSSPKHNYPVSQIWGAGKQRLAKQINVWIIIQLVLYFVNRT